VLYKLLSIILVAVCCVSVAFASDLSKADTAFMKISKALKAENSIVENMGNNSEKIVKSSKFNLQIKQSLKNTNIIMLLNSGDSALRIGHNEAAIVLFNTILRKTKEDHDALFGLATAYQLRKDFVSAKETYIRLINSYPANHSVDHKIVSNFINLIKYTDPAEAEDKLNELYLANPNFVPVITALGSLYVDMEYYEKALDFWQKAYQNDQNDIIYSYNLAILYDHLGKSSKAAELYRAILYSDTEELRSISVTKTQISDRLMYITRLDD
jgi:tetratricopeptide (TPR) repeat protein